MIGISSQQEIHTHTTAKMDRFESELTKRSGLPRSMLSLVDTPGVVRRGYPNLAGLGGVQKPLRNLEFSEGEMLFCAVDAMPVEKSCSARDVGHCVFDDNRTCKPHAVDSRSG